MIKGCFKGCLIGGVALFTCLILGIFLFSNNGSEVAPEELKYSSSEEIKILTGIKEFPDFSHSENRQDGEGLTTVYYKFDKKLSNDLISMLDSKVKDNTDNYWRIDTIWTDPGEFPKIGGDAIGNQRVWVCERNWDGVKIKAPSNSMDSCQFVKITIGESGFRITYSNKQHEWDNYAL